MKTVLRVVLVGFALWLPSRPVAAGVRMLRPERGEQMWLSVGGKERMYYRLESGDTTAVKVKGPGELKLIVRGVAPSTDSTFAYSLDFFDGGRKLKSVHAETGPDPVKWKGGKIGATRSRSAKLRLGPGNHVLRVAFRSETLNAVGIRYAFRAGATSGPQTPFQAQGTRGSVRLLVKERPEDYYIADATFPVTVDVIGPTRLRVVSRLLFRPGARGRQPYELKLQRDGNLLPDQACTTTKSAVVECESHPDWIFGESKTFYVEIPKGSHRVELRLANAESPAVALRFSIPKKDVANGR